MNTIDVYCPACGKMVVAKPSDHTGFPQFAKLSRHNDDAMDMTCVDSNVRVRIRVGVHYSETNA